MYRRMLRLIGVGASAGVAGVWIRNTIAAASRRHGLALRHGLKAAAQRTVFIDVTAAILILARGGRRRHRDKGQCEQRRGRCSGDLQKLFRLVLPVC